MTVSFNLSGEIIGIIASLFAIVQGSYAFHVWMKRRGVYKEAEEEKEMESVSNLDGHKNLDKYVFNDSRRAYGKGRLVQAIVVDFVAKNPDITVAGLKAIFKDDWQGSYIVRSVDERFKIGGKRFSHDFFNGGKDVITLRGGAKVVVCRQWGKSNIGRFFDGVASLGYKIKAVKVNEGER